VNDNEKVNILLVDDQPAKLLSYEVILSDLDENLIKANSAREALEQLLRNEIAIVLTDVSMPDLDGFELAAMIREHPRYQRTAIIFISGIYLSDLDRLRGYQAGAVDYVPVPVVPELLRAKVKISRSFIVRPVNSSTSTPNSNTVFRSVRPSWSRLTPNSNAASRSALGNGSLLWRNCMRCRKWKVWGNLQAASLTILTTC
jgi:CheY-like chemotaxis protein